MAVIDPGDVDDDVRNLTFGEIRSEVSFDYLSPATREGLLTDRGDVFIEKALKTYYDRQIPLRTGWSILNVSKNCMMVEKSMTIPMVKKKQKTPEVPNFSCTICFLNCTICFLNSNAYF